MQLAQDHIRRTSRPTFKEAGVPSKPANVAFMIVRGRSLVKFTSGTVKLKRGMGGLGGGVGGVGGEGGGGGLGGGTRGHGGGVGGRG